MSKLALGLTTTAVQTIDLKLSQRKRLQTALREHTELANTIDELTEEKEAQAAIIEAIREASGLQSFEFEGAKVTRVNGTTSYLDKQMLIDEGWLSPTQLEEATKSKPKKAYTSIAAPGRRKKRKEED